MSNDTKWFDDRPRRTARCSHCGGGGTVDQPYALAPAMRPAVDSTNGAIWAFVVGAFDIFTACQEALDISLRSGEPVAFQFLDHTVVVHPGDVASTSAREWWIRQYGETPEQVQARR